MSSNMQHGSSSADNGEGEGLVGRVERVESAIGAVSIAPVAETK
jgi:hypothetical protein